MREKKKSKPTQIANILESVVSSLGLTRCYKGWQVVTKWEEIVGEYNAKHAPAFKFDDGVLYLEVEDAAKRANLSMQQEEFMEKIHTYPFGRVVKQLRFVSGRKGI